MCSTCPAALYDAGFDTLRMDSNPQCQSGGRVCTERQGIFMKRYFIITGTVTYAIKCRDVLRRNGCHAELKRTSNTTGNVGCGYGVLSACDLSEIKRLLQANGIKYLQIREEE